MAHDEHERPDAARTAVVGPGKATFVTTSIHESHVAEGTYVASAHDAHLGIRSRQNDELETQLREKVKSKMEEAKLLGGVVAVVLGLFVNAEAVKGLGNPLEVRLAAVSFLV